MIDVPVTPDNRALAAAVQARMAADGRIVNAKAALWRLLGLGGLCALIGAGVGLGCYGYSFINQQRPVAEQIANALASALEHTTLHGMVSVDPAANIALAPDQQVTLAQHGPVIVSGTVDAQGTVKVVGPIQSDIQRPTQRQLGMDTANQNHTPVVTGFTVFKEVKYSKGEVVTGWRYKSSEEPNPESQYCYYTEKSTATMGLQVDLGSNGTFKDSPDKPVNVDLRDAFRNCVWQS